MPIPKTEAPQEQGNPYVPPGPEPLICDQFMGINTSTTRVGVDEKQMWWCSGYFPIGPHQLRTLPGIGPILWTPTTSTILFHGFANIGAAPIAVVFLADGSIFQVNTATGVATQMATPGTLVNPSVNTVGMSQWGSQYVLIVNKGQNNGYFIWDGVSLYRGGTLAPPVTLTATGSGYTSVPTVAASGGSGTGATFSVTLTQTGGIVDFAPRIGSGGYGGAFSFPSCSVSVSGGGGSGASFSPVFQLQSTGPDVYIMSSITINNPGSGYSGSPTFVFASNFAIAFPNYSPVVGTSGSVALVTITNPGTGYVSGDMPTLGFSGGGGSGATATVNIMPFGVNGTDVETAFQRVWIINGPLLQFAAPGSFQDFSTASGGGSVTSNDSFLRVGYTRLIQTGGFLYLIGDSSVNYISGVQTSGVSPTTTFTNQNADPEVGTPYPMTADVFGRNIVFANSFGAHVSYGAAVTKISEALDGVYNSLPNFGGQQPSAGKATIFGKKVWVLLLPIIDPATNQTSNELMLWDGAKKWWSSKQDRALTFINFQEINSVLTCWGTDGASLFPLFQLPSVGFTKTMQTKLWSKPGGYQVDKAITRFWGAVQYYARIGGAGDFAFNFTFDTESSTQAYSLTPPDIDMTWTTDGTTLMTWTTDGVTPMTWTLGTIGIRLFAAQAVGQHGVLNGLTASTTAADAAIISLNIQPEAVGYRG